MHSFLFRILTTSLIVFGLFFVAPLAHAQEAGDEISVDVIPALPAPGENTTISLSSFTANLDGAKITWTVNGTVKLSSFGAKKYSLTAGKVGITTKIVISIILPTGEKVEKTIVIQPAEADLLWQAVDSYTPPFYKGRALPASEALIKVVAIPNIKNQNASLVYNWKKNYQVAQAESGFGKNAYSFRVSYLNKNEKIGVVISAPDGTYAANKEVTIIPVATQILFYRTKPLEGPKYNHALEGTFLLTDTETTLLAEPYYFSPDNKESSQLKYTWKLNNTVIRMTGKQSELVVRKGDNTNGVAKIDVAIESIPKLFQLNNTSLMINLGAK